MTPQAEPTSVPVKATLISARTGARVWELNDKSFVSCATRAERPPTISPCQPGFLVRSGLTKWGFDRFTKWPKSDLWTAL